eukprot:scaffold30231_cov93-Skeletonema_marinoi.AAC.1
MHRRNAEGRRHHKTVSMNSVSKRRSSYGHLPILLLGNPFGNPKDRYPIIVVRVIAGCCDALRFMLRETSLGSRSLVSLKSIKATSMLEMIAVGTVVC